MLRPATTADTEAVVTLAYDEEVAWFGVPESSREEIAHYLGFQGGVESGVVFDDTARIAWLHADGWTHARSAIDLTLRGAAPVATPVWPDGVSLRRYVRGDDDAAVHHLVYVDAAFAGVPGRDRLEQPTRVAVAERSSGLGRALLLHSFADLLEAGADDLGLTVQAANNQAIGLYRSVGLDVQKECLVFSRRPT